MMRAIITEKPGSPEVLKLKEIQIPKLKPGWVLIKVMAFGLNRSELFTRQGHSPGVEFPRIQGIECVGEVAEDPSAELKVGQKVAAIMGEMGRAFDGGYAEYTAVPHHILFPFQSELPWEKLGAIPEMFQTVAGSLNEALEVKDEEVLLIRGGTSSIGITACQLAKFMGLKVISTTRNPASEDFLMQNGSDWVVIDDGQICQKVNDVIPQGVDKVLELVGTVTLKDSLKCCKPRGIVCMTGILGNQWTMAEFSPMGDIPSQVRLTCYGGDAENLSSAMLQEFIDLIEKGKINLVIDRTFNLEEVPEAHQYMEDNKAKGKLVVVTNHA